MVTRQRHVSNVDTPDNVMNSTLVIHQRHESNIGQRSSSLCPILDKHLLNIAVRYFMKNIGTMALESRKSRCLAGSQGGVEQSAITELVQKNLDAFQRGSIPAGRTAPLRLHARGEDGAPGGRRKVVEARRRRWSWSAAEKDRIERPDSKGLGVCGGDRVAAGDRALRDGDT